MLFTRIKHEFAMNGNLLFIKSDKMMFAYSLEVLLLSLLNYTIVTYLSMLHQATQFFTRSASIFHGHRTHKAMINCLTTKFKSFFFLIVFASDNENLLEHGQEGGRANKKVLNRIVFSDAFRLKWSLRSFLVNWWCKREFSCGLWQLRGGEKKWEINFEGKCPCRNDV